MDLEQTCTSSSSGWIKPFSWKIFSLAKAGKAHVAALCLRELVPVFWYRAHSLTGLTGTIDGKEPLLMLLVTPVLFLLWVKCLLWKHMITSKMLCIHNAELPLSECCMYYFIGSLLLMHILHIIFCILWVVNLYLQLLFVR